MVDDVVVGVNHERVQLSEHPRAGTSEISDIVQLSTSGATRVDAQKGLEAATGIFFVKVILSAV
jgi:hypothetical protein